MKRIQLPEVAAVQGSTRHKQIIERHKAALTAVELPIIMARGMEERATTILNRTSLA